jgi:hypothetical protein
MSQQGERIQRPGLAALAIDHERHHVLGYPLHVGITVRANSPTASLKRLPLASPSGDAGAIGIHLTAAGAPPEAARARPGPVLDGDFAPTFDLEPGSSRRMLVDLSHHLPAGLAPGHYLLKVVYSARIGHAESPPVPVELSAPSPEEQAALDRLAPAVERAGSWSRWTYLPSGGDDPDAWPGPRDPLRFNRVLRALMFGREELSRVSPARLDVLAGVYEPESHALRAELFHARGDQARFSEEAEIIRARWPGLLWWIEKIASGRSEIAFMRASYGPKP